MACSWRFIAVCCLLPALNGGLNGFPWAGFSLYYRDMGWDLWRAGLTTSLGFGLRIFTQQMQLHIGLWTALPLSLVHVALAIAAMIYSDVEWVVATAVVGVLCLDTTIAVEGIAFDIWGESEEDAVKASSVSLSSFTVLCASAATFAGLIYDAYSWFGLTVYHVVFISIEVVLLFTEPACWQSLRDWWRPKEEQEEVVTAMDQVVPAPKPGKEVGLDLPTLPGAVEDEPAQKKVSKKPTLETKRSTLPADFGGLRQPKKKEDIFLGKTRPRGSLMSSLGPLERLRLRNSFLARASQVEAQTLADSAARKARRSQATSNKTVEKPRASSMADVPASAKRLFASHSGVMSFEPSKDAESEEEEEEEEGGRDIEQDEQVGKKKTSLGRGLWLPASLILLNSLSNNVSYVIEWSTFAIFFREQHGWTSATWAGLAQTSGDLVAACMMQFACCKNVDEDEDVGCVRRFFRNITRQPYNLSCLLAFWVLFNGGMMAPSLAPAVVSQIFMGTVYVYSMKMTTDLNLFYSLGDPGTFLTLQVLAKNAESLGATFAGFLGMNLYEMVHPLAPFMFSTVVSALIFVAYTLGFCKRVGYGLDIEVAEARRAQRLGSRRMKSWRKSTRELGSRELGRSSVAEGA